MYIILILFKCSQLVIQTITGVKISSLNREVVLILRGLNIGVIFFIKFHPKVLSSLFRNGLNTVTEGIMVFSTLKLVC